MEGCKRKRATVSLGGDSMNFIPSIPVHARYDLPYKWPLARAYMAPDAVLDAGNGSASHSTYVRLQVSGSLGTEYSRVTFPNIDFSDIGMVKVFTAGSFSGTGRWQCRAGDTVLYTGTSVNSEMFEDARAVEGVKDLVYEALVYSAGDGSADLQLYSVEFLRVFK